MSDESLITSSASYQIEMLKATNWMLAVLHNLGLETYIAKDAVAPGFTSDPQNWMKDEETALKK